MKFLALAVVLAIPAVAAPEPAANGISLAARDKVKLNQYRTMEDCNNDKDILYHAAPVSGKCYDLDAATGAFFYNTAGYAQSYSYDNKGCGGTPHKLQRYTGKCVEKGTQNSVKFT
ncbi:hypothetical protein F4778DRAFT_783449 [Xylariomycetidae sp. FL2044]|nr:hypothetical protein F4778DRAFT_783449 [Xylariomycetidae sp. FL2044]